MKGKKKWQRPNGRLTNRGQKRYTSLKESIAELKKAVQKREGSLRKCQKENLEMVAEITHLKNMIKKKGEKIKKLRK